MAGVHQAPRRGKGGLPSSARRRLEALRLDDPAELGAWLAQVKESVEDLAAAAEDATRPPGKRALGRAMARSKVLESRRCLRALVEAFERGLRR
jgi:hypothetical protein